MQTSLISPTIERKRGPRFKLSRADAELVVLAYGKAETSVEALARKFGVTKQTIYNVMARLRRETLTGPDARWS